MINFFEKVYCRLASDPFSLVDDVIESVHSVNMTPSAHFSECVEKRYYCILEFTGVLLH